MESKKQFVVNVDADLKPLIPKFMSKQKECMEKLKMALRSQNFGDLKTLGHQMKGSCGGYGFSALGNFGANIEQLAEARAIELLSQNIVELEKYLANIQIEYKKTNKT